jgi:hypothetical protein
MLPLRLQPATIGKYLNIIWPPEGRLANFAGVNS